MAVENQPAQIVTTPEPNAAVPLTEKKAVEPESVVTSSVESKPSEASSSTTYGQVKQKTRKISSSLANSTKDWRKTWGKMNKDRIVTDDNEAGAVPDQKADMQGLKQQYNRVKESVVDTSKAAMDKVNEMSQ